MERFIHFVLNQRLFIVIATLVLSATGWFFWINLPIDAFPDTTNVQVMILTEAPGLAPVDVEQQVTFPMEIAMQGLPDIREIRSLSKAAFSQVIIVFEDHVDTYFARQLVFERLQSAKRSLPSWAEPEMGPISTGLGEIYQYTLESDTHDPMALRTIQDWLIAPQLRILSGVNEVNSFGGFVKQYQVIVDPKKLLKFGITLQDVLAAIENNNANAGGNFLIKGWEQSYVRSVGMIETLSDLEDIVLKTEDGTPVFLKDTARVVFGPETRQGAVTRDGKGEAVAGMVIMLRGENSKVVVDRIKKAIPKIQVGLPEGVRINPFYDRTALIQACIQTIGSALTQAGIFVVLVLLLFLGNLRASLIVALSLPLTAMIAFILMGFSGVTANLMSLGGLAIAIGTIVDASIVITENIIRHNREAAGSGLTQKQIAFQAIHEVARPILFAVLIIIIVFLPLFTLQEMEGKMFRPLALTMCFAMIGSLLISFTIIPVLGMQFLGGSKKKKENIFLKSVKKGYMRVLSGAMNRRWATLMISFFLFLFAVLLIPFVGTSFLPQLDEGAIAINVVRLPSASLKGSVAVGLEMEKQLMNRFPEIKTVVTKTGRAEISEDPMGPEQNDVFVILHMEKDWKTGRDKKQLVIDMQEMLMRLPGLRFSFSQPIALRVNELISGIKSDLAIKIFGPDLEVLGKTGNRIAVLVGGIEGAEDTKLEQIAGFSQIEVLVDRKAAARHKINVKDINDIIETAVGGKIASTVVEGQKRFAVQVRFPEEHRRDIQALSRILIPSSEGRHIPMGQIVKIVEKEAPAQISRENGMRRVVVECNIRGRDMGSFVKEVQNALVPVIKDLPAGYFLDFGGQFENQKRAMKRLSIVVPISVALIFLMLFSAFDSVKNAFLVLVNLPFALVGGILAIFFLNIHLSVSAAVGFIALFGIAVENGTVLVSFFEQLRKQGLGTIEAVKKGCELRFRPLLMTAMTTLLGLLPLLYATGSGSEIQRPLATVVLGGLLSALFLTLIVLPVLYSLTTSDRTDQ